MSEIYKINDIIICKIIFQNMSNPELNRVKYEFIKIKNACAFVEMQNTMEIKSTHTHIKHINHMRK